MTVKPLLILSSSRRGGNSELLAEAVVRGLECTRLYLPEKRIEPVVDQRHVPGGFTPVDDDYAEIVALLRTHDTLIFATPIYWYGMAGPLKDFFDRWSQVLRDPSFAFKAELAQKRAFVVLAGSDNPRIKGLPLILQFQHIFGFVGMDFAGYVIGEGNRPGEVLQDGRALAEAEWLGRQVAAKG